VFSSDRGGNRRCLRDGRVKPLALETKSSRSLHVPWNRDFAPTIEVGDKPGILVGNVIGVSSFGLIAPGHGNTA
jgi:hypothetical protein